MNKEIDEITRQEIITVCLNILNSNVIEVSHSRFSDDIIEYHCPFCDKFKPGKYLMKNILHKDDCAFTVAEKLLKKLSQ